MSEMIFTQPSPETPAPTGWENMDNQAQQLPEVDPAEPVAQPVFGTEAVPAAETPAVEAPATETPATEAEPLTFPEGAANDAYELEGRGNLGDEIAAEGSEPVAQPVFGTEAVPAAETPAVETPAVEAPATETPATEAEPLTFPEGAANDAYELEGRGNLGDEIAAEGEPKTAETIAETTATPEANENKEAILQAIADIRNKLDAIEASL